VLSGTGKFTRNPNVKELSLKKAKFTKKADVFAAGIIFLELITMCSPELLYKSLWPRILKVSLPPALKEILKLSLEAAPEARSGSFVQLFEILNSDQGKAIGELSRNDELTLGINEILPSRLTSLGAKGIYKRTQTY
jgi:hypothetical protein